MENSQFSEKFVQAITEASSAIAEILSFIDQSLSGLFDDNIIEAFDASALTSANTPDDKHIKRIDQPTKMLTNALTIIHFISNLYEHAPNSVQLNDSAIDTVGKTIDLTRLDFSSFQGYYSMAKRNDSFYDSFPKLKDQIIWLYDQYTIFAEEANRLIVEYNDNNPTRKIKSPNGFSAMPV
jgi:hypothetical protein